MKSKQPAAYFRNYIMSFPDHYKDVIENYLQNQDKTFCWKPMPTDCGKLGEVYFSLFQLFSIYNHLCSRKNSGKDLKYNQRDLIIEIMRIMEKNHDKCFRQVEFENFLETFGTLIYQSTGQSPSEQSFSPMTSTFTNRVISSKQQMQQHPFSSSSD